MDSQTVIAELNRCKDIDTMILKGHLLVEQHLIEFIQRKAVEQVDYTKINFAMKVKICQILGLFARDKELLKSVTLLNKLRNELAHDLQPKREKLEQYIEGLADDIHLNQGLNMLFENQTKLLMTTLDNEKYWTRKQNYYVLHKIVSTCNVILAHFPAT